MHSKIRIYGSLNLEPTDFLVNQIRQLFSTIILCQILNTLNAIYKFEVQIVD